MADALALESHRKALAAQDTGRFEAEIVPVRVPLEDSEQDVPEIVFDRDEGPRRETSPEALARLKPAFGAEGIITAGNASQRSDGAAAVVLMTWEKAQELGLTPWARFMGYAVAAVAPEEFGIAPAYAIPKLLRRTGSDD